MKQEYLNIILLLLEVFFITSNCQKGCIYQKMQGLSFSQCVKECKMFKDEQSAIIACNNDKYCKGVTYTNIQFDIFQLQYFKGQYSYQIRSGDLVLQSDPQIFSIQKQLCSFQERCKFTQVQTNGLIQRCLHNCRDYPDFLSVKSECDIDQSCDTFLLYTQRQVVFRGSQPIINQLQQGAKLTFVIEINGKNWVKECQQEICQINQIQF